MQVKYWTNFSKRKNSTKQPSGGTEISVSLKNPCSVENPQIEVVGVPDSANYFYIADFGRYYFRSDAIKVTKDITQFSLEVDTMATYKANVGATAAFVVRSANGYNADIADSLVMPTTKEVQNVITEGDVLSNLNVLSNDLVVYSVGQGGFKKYIMSPSQIQAVLSTYFDGTNLHFSTPAEAIQALFTAVADPSKYIKAVKWFPFDVSGGGSEIPSWGFTVGNVSVNVAKDALSSSTTISKPARYYNDWRDFDDRFTKCSIRLPGIGLVPVPAIYLQDVLSVTYEVDVNTGDAKTTVVAGQKIIGTYSTNVAVDVPVAGLNGTGALSVFSEAPFAMNLNPVSFASNMKSITQSAIGMSLQPDTAVYSASGNARDWVAAPFVQCCVVRLGSTELSPNGNGRASNKNATISSLSGYIQCQNASVDMPGTVAEKDTVNGYVNGGFYYE